MIPEHLLWLGIVRGALYLSSHLTLTIPYEANIILILQMKKLRFRYVMETIQIKYLYL